MSNVATVTQEHRFCYTTQGFDKDDISCFLKWNHVGLISFQYDTI